MITPITIGGNLCHCFLFPCLCTYTSVSFMIFFVIPMHVWVKSCICLWFFYFHQLNMYGCTAITDTSLNWIGLYCSAITKLDVSLCAQVCPYMIMYNFDIYLGHKYTKMDNVYMHWKLLNWLCDYCHISDIWHWIAKSLSSNTFTRVFGSRQLHLPYRWGVTWFYP